MRCRVCVRVIQIRGQSRIQSRSVGLVGRSSPDRVQLMECGQIGRVVSPESGDPIDQESVGVAALVCFHSMSSRVLSSQCIKTLSGRLGPAGTVGLGDGDALYRINSRPAT
jgi:hypothetical protein